MTSSGPPRQHRLSRYGRDGIPAGRILGVPITLDLSWFIILALLLGTFSAASFPALLPGEALATYLMMGTLGTMLFFISLLGHELAHAVEARRRGIEVEGITLFVFGGMARTRTDPRRPVDEFVIAGVGPLASLVIGVVLVLLSSLVARWGLDPAAVVLRYLGFLNVALAVFNLLPGFPLDGGRLLRSLVWGFTGSIRKGTRVATVAGRVLGAGLMALGAFSVLNGQGIVGGVWIVFIGWFLVQAATSSYDQVLLAEVLKGVSAGEGMTPDPETVGPELSVDILVNEHFLRRPYSAFPVTEGGVVQGLVTLSQVKALSRERWGGTRVSEIMLPREELTLVAPETPMLEVLERMAEANGERALVAREGELVGIISARDLTRWLDRAGLLSGEAGPRAPGNGAP
jgi:Zn-dependent protease/CBS domain-containing protein